MCVSTTGILSDVSGVFDVFEVSDVSGVFDVSEVSYVFDDVYLMCI